MINEMIQNANLSDTPIVLNSVWTDNKDFCCSLMGDYQMMTDMVECQDLIAALSIAESRGIDIPKLSATEDLEAHDINGWFAVNVDIMSPVSNDFMQILIDIQEGVFDFKQKTQHNRITMISDNDSMIPFILQLKDNINIINATQML